MDTVYRITKMMNVSDNEMVATVSIDFGHSVFEGHFPDNPVLPGVITVDIIKGVLSKFLDKELTLKKAGNIKFMNIINPRKNDVLWVKINFSLSDNIYKVKATVFFENTIFVKFSGDFYIIK